jgi:hypothetical protein
VPSKHDPAGCLADIIENLERIEGYVSGMDQDTFASNNMLRDAMERCLKRVCEAAHRLGDRGPELMPSHPGETSAAWATGCGTLMTESARKCFGMPPATICRRCGVMHGSR